MEASEVLQAPKLADCDSVSIRILSPHNDTQKDSYPDKSQQNAFVEENEQDNTQSTPISFKNNNPVGDQSNPVIMEKTGDGLMASTTEQNIKSKAVAAEWMELYGGLPDDLSTLNIDQVKKMIKSDLTNCDYAKTFHFSDDYIDNLVDLITDSMKDALKRDIDNIDQSSEKPVNNKDNSTLSSEIDSNNDTKSLSTPLLQKPSWLPTTNTILFYSIYALLSIGFALLYLFKMYYSVYFTVLSGWILLAKFCAGIIYFNSSVIFLIACSGIISWLQSQQRLRQYIPINTIFTLHKLCGWSMVIAGIGHSFAHLAGTFRILSNVSCEATNNAPYCGHSYLAFLYRSIPGTTGVLLLIAFIAIAFTSRRSFRSKYFPTFITIHHMFIPIVILLCAHGTAGFVQVPHAWRYLAIPFVLYCCDRLYRHWSSRQRYKMKLRRVRILDFQLPPSNLDKHIAEMTDIYSQHEQCIDGYCIHSHSNDNNQINQEPQDNKNMTTWRRATRFKSQTMLRVSQFIFGQKGDINDTNNNINNNTNNTHNIQLTDCPYNTQHNRQQSPSSPALNMTVTPPSKPTPFIFGKMESFIILDMVRPSTNGQGLSASWLDVMLSQQQQQQQHINNGKNDQSLSSSHNADYTFKAGQYARVLIPQVSLIPHPITIASSPDNTDSVIFIIKVAGRWTQGIRTKILDEQYKNEMMLYNKVIEQQKKHIINNNNKDNIHYTVPLHNNTAIPHKITRGPSINIRGSVNLGHFVTKDTVNIYNYNPQDGKQRDESENEPTLFERTSQALLKGRQSWMNIGDNNNDTISYNNTHKEAHKIHNTRISSHIDLHFDCKDDDEDRSSGSGKTAIAGTAEPTVHYTNNTEPGMSNRNKNDLQYNRSPHLISQIKLFDGHSPTTILDSIDLSNQDSLAVLEGALNSLFIFGSDTNNRSSDEHGGNKLATNKPIVPGASSPFPVQVRVSGWLYNPTSITVGLSPSLGAPTTSIQSILRNRSHTGAGDGWNNYNNSTNNTSTTQQYDYNDIDSSIQPAQTAWDVMRSLLSHSMQNSISSDTTNEISSTSTTSTSTTTTSSKKNNNKLYNNSSNNNSNIDHLVMVAGGVGITPFMSNMSLLSARLRLSDPRLPFSQTKHVLNLSRSLIKDSNNNTNNNDDGNTDDQSHSAVVELSLDGCSVGTRIQSPILDAIGSINYCDNNQIVVQPHSTILDSLIAGRTVESSSLHFLSKQRLSPWIHAVQRVLDASFHNPSNNMGINTTDVANNNNNMAIDAFRPGTAESGSQYSAISFSGFSDQRPSNEMRQSDDTIDQGSSLSSSTLSASFPHHNEGGIHTKSDTEFDGQSTVHTTTINTNQHHQYRSSATGRHRFSSAHRISLDIPRDTTTETFNTTDINQNNIDNYNNNNTINHANIIFDSDRYSSLLFSSSSSTSLHNYHNMKINQGNNRLSYDSMPCELFGKSPNASYEALYSDNTHTGNTISHSSNDSHNHPHSYLLYSIPKRRISILTPHLGDKTLLIQNNTKTNQFTSLEIDSTETQNKANIIHSHVDYNSIDCKQHWDNSSQIYTAGSSFYASHSSCQQQQQMQEKHINSINNDELAVVKYDKKANDQDGGSKDHGEDHGEDFVHFAQHCNVHNGFCGLLKINKQLTHNAVGTNGDNNMTIIEPRLSAGPPPTHTGKMQREERASSASHFHTKDTSTLTNVRWGLYSPRVSESFPSDMYMSTIASHLTIPRKSAPSSTQHILPVLVDTTTSNNIDSQSVYSINQTLSSLQAALLQPPPSTIPILIPHDSIIVGPYCSLLDKKTYYTSATHLNPSFYDYTTISTTTQSVPSSSSSSSSVSSSSLSISHHPKTSQNHNSTIKTHSHNSQILFEALLSYLTPYTSNPLTLFGKELSVAFDILIQEYIIKKTYNNNNYNNSKETNNTTTTATNTLPIPSTQDMTTTTTLDSIHHAVLTAALILVNYHLGKSKYINNNNNNNNNNITRDIIHLRLLTLCLTQTYFQPALPLPLSLPLSSSYILSISRISCCLASRSSYNLLRTCIRRLPLIDLIWGLRSFHQLSLCHEIINNLVIASDLSIQHFHKGGILKAYDNYVTSSYNDNNNNKQSQISTTTTTAKRKGLSPQLHHHIPPFLSWVESFMELLVFRSTIFVTDNNLITLAANPIPLLKLLFKNDKQYDIDTNNINNNSKTIHSETLLRQSTSSSSSSLSHDNHHYLCARSLVQSYNQQQKQQQQLQQHNSTNQNNNTPPSSSSHNQHDGIKIYNKDIISSPYHLSLSHLATTVSHTFPFIDPPSLLLLHGQHLLSNAKALPTPDNTVTRVVRPPIPTFGTWDIRLGRPTPEHLRHVVCSGTQSSVKQNNNNNNTVPYTQRMKHTRAYCCCPLPLSKAVEKVAAEVTATGATQGTICDVESEVF